jgi:hypothetical protein
LSLSALGVTNQACWVALFADFVRTLRVDFREKVETAQLSRTYALGRRPEAFQGTHWRASRQCHPTMPVSQYDNVNHAAPDGRLVPPLVGGFWPPW